MCWEGHKDVNFCLPSLMFGATKAEIQIQHIQSIFCFKGLLIFISSNGSLSVRRVTNSKYHTTSIASMFGHTCTITTSFTPVISLQELELMSGTWCWRWSREKPLTLSIHTMDNSLGPIIGNFPVSLTASPTRQDSIYTIHHHAQESRWILVSTGQEHALTNSRISCSQGALLNSELSASACCGSNHQDVTSSWVAFIRFLRGMSTTEEFMSFTLSGGEPEERPGGLADCDADS